MDQRDIIFVLGGRSGTSALTRVLSLCGCSLPSAVLGSHPDNQRGFWEPVEAVNLNRKFLAHHGIPGDPSMPLQERDVDPPARAHFTERIRAFLSTCPAGPRLLIKDPRICELLEFWLQGARDTGFAVKVVLAIRHPQEVFASAKASADREFVGVSGACSVVTIEASNAAWLKSNLLAERYSRELPRVVVDFGKLMTNWRTQVSRIARVLSVDLVINETAVDSFLSAHLYHQRHLGPVTETFGYSWTTRVYATLSAAAEDKPLDYSALDEIGGAYRATARAFRIAMDFSRNRTLALQSSHESDPTPIWRSGRDY